MTNFIEAAEEAPDFQEAQYDAAIASAKLKKKKEALMWLGKIDSPPDFLKKRAEKADEFRELKNEKIFKKFIEG